MPRRSDEREFVVLVAILISAFAIALLWLLAEDVDASALASREATTQLPVHSTKNPFPPPSGGERVLRASLELPELGLVAPTVGHTMHGRSSSLEAHDWS